MALSVVVRDAPTLSDAQAAADALVAAGVAQVLVFGSVACGEATPHSDIDLVAVFDDLGDYGERAALRRALSDAASAAANRPVDVTVTDRPEWRRRTLSVSASFEAKIAAGARVLVDRPPAVEVLWDKQIGRPMTNLAEAQARAGEASFHLLGLLYVLRPGMDEVLRTPNMRFIRHRKLCYESSMAVESLAKAQIALGGVYPAREHQLRLLLNQLEPDPQRAFEELVARHGLNPVEVSMWRVKGTYVDDKWPMEEVEADADRLAPALVALACELGELVVEAIAQADGDASSLQDAVSQVRGIVAVTDIRTGERRGA